MFILVDSVEYGRSENNSDAYLQHIDNTREDGRFPVSASYVIIQKRDPLSSGETGVNPGIES
jgi:hypothetical protein